MNTNSFIGLIGLSNNYLGHGKFLSWKNENAPVKVALPQPTFVTEALRK